MCELFAMSSLLPTLVDFSLELLARRGGAEGPHRDGWGVAYYAGRDALLLREPGAASESDLVRHIERHGPPSSLVISHIRLATTGEVALCNTQPFARELGGRMHLFAHNGDLPGIHTDRAFAPGRFLPVGDTDSELAFCALMARLDKLWAGAADAAPTLSDRLAVIGQYAARLRGLGTANFLYADSEVLFAHADHRMPPNSQARFPGLHVLERSCQEAVPDLSGSGVMLQDATQALTLVASVPLTEEAWQPMHEGEILAIAGGRILQRQRA
jgi:predicted glutamine amidotransferase